MNLDKDEKGNLVETDDTRFFRVKPRFLPWEGIVNVKSQSVLAPSKQIEKALELEMYNMLIPLLAQPPQLYSQVAQALVKLYDKDPKDILPPSWLQDQEQQPNPQDQPLVIPANGQTQNMAVGVAGALLTSLPHGSPQTAEKLVTRTQLPSTNPNTVGSQISTRMSKPFRMV